MLSLLLYVADLRQLQLRILLGRPFDAPAVGKDDQVASFQIADPFGFGCQIERVGIEPLVEDPANTLIWKDLQLDVHVILAL